MSAEIRSPLEMFYHWEATTPDKVFLRQPHHLEWTEYTWAEIGQQVRRLATFINGQRLPPGSRIGIWSSNSKDWFVVDLAIMMSGHISVPIYPGQDVTSAIYIIEHSECAMIFLGGFDQAEHVDQAIPAGVVRVAMLGCKAPCQFALSDVIQDSPPFAESPVPDPDGLMMILYTSGTTGNPKGVMHLHATAGYVCPDLATNLRFESGTSRLMSYLPLSHIAERVLIEFCSLYTNATVSFSEGLVTFADELRSVQPTFFFSVPRLWTKFKEAVEARIPPAAMATLSDEQKAGIRQQLGLASANFIVSGSAPVSPEVQRWFLDLGVALRDGYGATENFIDGCAWMRDDNPLPGSVGTSMGTAEVKISEDNEILFRSKGVMKGYYRNPEKTAEVIVDGWYHTGDKGRFDANGNLWITERMSEVFKTSKGKFVEPQALENRFAKVAELGQTCIFGRGLDQPVLLANLSEPGRATARDELVRLLTQALAEVNAIVQHHERINQIFIARDEWQIGNGLLTPTMKLKRKAVETHYRDWVAARLNGGPVVFE